jgi:HAD superfamily hydrolase (TIGR01509 family)
MTIRAVIFDLDGVVIDTEYQAFKAWQRWLQRWGCELDEVDFQEIMGMDADRTILYTIEKTGLKIDLPTIKKEHEKMMLSLLDEDLEPVPGVPALILALSRRGVRLAIASNSTRGYIEQALQSLHLDREFSVIVGRDHVKSGKPAPDIYAATCAELGFLPEDCLAIEDSLMGVRSAVSAGTRCVAVPASKLAREDFQSAYAIYDNIAAVHADLDRLLA